MRYLLSPRSQGWPGATAAIFWTRGRRTRQGGIPGDTFTACKPLLTIRFPCWPSAISWVIVLPKRKYHSKEGLEPPLAAMSERLRFRSSRIRSGLSYQRHLHLLGK